MFQCTDNCTAKHLVKQLKIEKKIPRDETRRVSTLDSEPRSSSVGVVVIKKVDARRRVHMLNYS